MIDTASPEDTRALGQALGQAARPGDVILLAGELGAGKTVFVQGLARGLGFEGSVSSKSFVLMGEYAGRLTLYHADLFRLNGPEEVEDLALAEISAAGVLAVEWPERGDWALPAEHLLLRFEMTGECTRRITADAHGDRATELAEALA